MIIRSTMRARAKAYAPEWLRSQFRAARASLQPPAIDDVVLQPLRFAADGEPRARLSLVMPKLERATAFGGVATGLDLFLSIGRAVQALRPIDLRIMVTDSGHQPDRSLIDDRVPSTGGEQPRVDVVSAGSGPVRVRHDEAFFTFNFWTTLNTRPLIEGQSAHFGRPGLPQTYLIQEYEPHLFPFSSANIFAREAYDCVDRLWGLFNSSQLAAYFARQGHGVERAWTFEPVIPEALRAHLPLFGRRLSRDRTILVYGRPAVDRNCMPALRRALARWVAEYPEFADWEVVSVGMPHAPIALGGGRFIRSLGKLSLEDYAASLRAASVGISLMASPHPSYPPLEMAHFGLRTLTNRYLDKDLAGLHRNIVSLPSLDEGVIAETLAQACRAGPADPDAPPIASYLRTDTYQFAGEFAAALEAELSARG